MKIYIDKKPRVIPAILLGCVIALLSSSCDAISKRDIPTREVDWKQVEAISSTDAMGIMIVLSRDLDRWHKGSIETLKVSYSGIFLHDNAGKRREVSPAEWKGLVTLVHNTIQRSPDDYMSFRTAPNKLYNFDDGEGQLQRFLYHIRMINTETLEFRTIRAYD